MDGVIALLVAAVLSFWGSLQLGLVNVAVIETAISKGRKPAIWLAIGGVLPEIPYTLIAIYGVAYIDILKDYSALIGISVGVFLLAMGIYYYRRKSTIEIHPEHQLQQASSFKSFSKGFLLAMANPQLIVFWSGFLVLIQTGSLNIFTHKDTLIDFDALGWISPKLTFAFGAALGALGILLVYIKLSETYRDKLVLIVGDKLGKIVGVFFILMGLFAIVKNVI